MFVCDGRHQDQVTIVSGALSVCVIRTNISAGVNIPLSVPSAVMFGPTCHACALQKWSAHNQELQQHASSSTATQPSLAAEAIRCWRGVGRAARAALKRANVHSVLELEMQMVELMERAKV